MPRGSGGPAPVRRPVRRALFDPGWRLLALWLLTGGCSDGGCGLGGDFDCCDDCLLSQVGQRRCRDGEMQACREELLFCSGAPGWVSVDREEGCQSAAYSAEFEWECFEPALGEAACREVGASRCPSMGAARCDGAWIVDCRDGYWAHASRCGSESPAPELEFECVAGGPSGAFCREVGASACPEPGERSCDGAWVVECRDGFWWHLELCIAPFWLEGPFAYECAFGEADEAHCREVGAAPCAAPGAWGCDGAWVVVCTEIGEIEHRYRCEEEHGYVCNPFGVGCTRLDAADADAEADAIADVGRDADAAEDSFELPPDPVCGDAVVTRWEQCDGAPVPCRVFECFGMAECLEDCTASATCDLGEPPAGDECGGEDEPSLSDALGTRVVEGALCAATDGGFESPACPWTPGPDVGYLLDLHEPRRLWLSLHADGFRGALRVRSADACPGAERACSVAAPSAGVTSTELAVELPVGRHRVLVDSHDATGRGPFTLTYFLSVPAP